MINSINAQSKNSLRTVTTGRVSMIGILAMSVGIAAAPANAQDITAPDTTAPVSPVISSPIMEAPTANSLPVEAAPVPKAPVVRVNTIPQVAPDRADDLAGKGGFNVETVAPEALAQIEREQQEREAATVKAAAASINEPVKAPGRVIADAVDTSGVSDNRVDSISASSDGSTAAIVGGEMPVIPVPPEPSGVEAPDSFSGESDPDWGLLAALAAMLGIGSAGVYAAGRRKSKNLQTGDQAVTSSDNFASPASLNDMIMPELRRDPDRAETPLADDAGLDPTQSVGGKLSVEASFTEFVASLPAFAAPLDKGNRRVSMLDRRVAAAPRPYLGETDMSRNDGYFEANIDAMPTPQNPFLTRQKRLKRARFLDQKLTAMKTSASMGRTKQVSRPWEPAFS